MSMTAEELLIRIREEADERTHTQHKSCWRRVYWKDAKRYVHCEMCCGILEKAELQDADVLIEISWNTNCGRNELPEITNYGEIQACFESHDPSKCDYEPAAPLFPERRF